MRLTTEKIIKKRCLSMFMAYFITFGLIVTCIAFAVAIINTVKEFDQKALKE
ncbi:hypothetical protein ACLM5H_24415 [Fredinandcohnia humi]